MDYHHTYLPTMAHRNAPCRHRPNIKDGAGFEPAVVSHLTENYLKRQHPVIVWRLRLLASAFSPSVHVKYALSRSSGSPLAYGSSPIQRYLMGLFAIVKEQIKDVFFLCRLGYAILPL